MVDGVHRSTIRDSLSRFRLLVVEYGGGCDGGAAVRISRNLMLTDNASLCNINSIAFRGQHLPAYFTDEALIEDHTETVFERIDSISLYACVFILGLLGEIHGCFEKSVLPVKSRELELASLVKSRFSLSSPET
jgi:hypothetical protein